MELKIIGSSSAGNCYVFDNGRESLIVECGISFQEVKKAVNFDISRIVGCLISHEHGDHARHVNKFLDARIKVFASMGTINALGIVPMYEKPKFYPIGLKANAKQTIGNFMVLPFSVQHDAAEPFGFLIHHHEMGTTLFATDTCYLAYKFSGLNNILIECNYRQDILERNTDLDLIPQAQRDRTMQSHMSFSTCFNVLKENDLSAVNNIVLIHLSDSNSNALDFQKGIQEATGKTVHIAEKGMTINFNKSPF
ncbi:MBL fold metallo-hydrolase [Bacteroidia bacterium]|nr:MBL fold metallo-hydrolase [Bacteroidia bacterium]GHV71223.1 MBL fold metallo-hydrolase [Bacteroidia bacterium]